MFLSSSPLGSRSVAESYDLSGGDPPAPTDTARGILLDSVSRLAVHLRATDWFPSRAVLQGMGNLAAYVLASGSAQWSRARDLDLGVPPHLDGKSDYAWGEVKVPHGARLCFSPEGLTTDHGPVVVEYHAASARGDRL